MISPWVPMEPSYYMLIFPSSFDIADSIIALRLSMEISISSLAVSRRSGSESFTQIWSLSAATQTSREGVTQLDTRFHPGFLIEVGGLVQSHCNSDGLCVVSLSVSLPWTETTLHRLHTQPLRSLSKNRDTTSGSRLSDLLSQLSSQSS